MRPARGHPLGKIIDAPIGRIESAESLDRPGHLLGKAVSRTGQVVGRPAKGLTNTLRDQPYGAPLIVAVPVGTWTLAMRAGASGAAAAIVTGVADWQHLNGRDRRTGLVHGTVNLTALCLNRLSGRLRVHGQAAAHRPGLPRASSGAAGDFPAPCRLGGAVHGPRVRLEDVLDREHTSRFRQAFRALKVSLLEGAGPRRMGRWRCLHVFGAHRRMNFAILTTLRSTFRVRGER